MWHGEDTDELRKLNKKYYEMFGIYPFGHMELEYGQDDYEEYVQDIKKAIKEKRELPDFVE